MIFFTNNGIQIPSKSYKPNTQKDFRSSQIEIPTEIHSIPCIPTNQTDP